MARLKIKVSAKNSAALKTELASNATRKNSVYSLNKPKPSLQVREPSPEQIQKNILVGQKALSRAKKQLLKPGVKITFAKNVPVYSADSMNPDVLVMKFNGKSIKGRMVSGKFKPVQ